MDIKVSRFDKIPPSLNQGMSLGQPKQNTPETNEKNEELIPNEEPLIQIRQFNGSGATNSQHIQNKNLQ